MNAKQSLKLTFDWFKFFYKNKNTTKILNLSLNQINDYQKKINFSNSSQ